MGQLDGLSLEFVAVLPGSPGLIVPRHVWTAREIEVCVLSGEVQGPVEHFVSNLYLDLP